MKKLAFLALAIAAAGGCSTATTTSEDPHEKDLPTDGVTSTQLQAFNALEVSTKSAWSWQQHASHKTPMHLSTTSRTSGEKILARGGDAFKTTIDFVTQHKALFQMKNPSVELAGTKLDVDEIGMTHARFQQMTHGVPVAGAELMAHYDASGRITSIDANYVADLYDLDVQPKITTAEASALAKSHVLTQLSSIEANKLTSDAGKLVVYAPDDSTTARLAFEFVIDAQEAEDPAIWVTTVDAKTGVVLHQYNNFQTIRGSGTGVLGDEKILEVATNAAGFLMTDAAGGVQIKTYTAKNVQTLPGTQLTSTSATSWDTGVPGAGAAVDAHFNASVVFKYYKEHHARNAIDGNGTAMVSTVHFGDQYDNAAWNGSGMLYGDGKTVFKPLSASLDVVGHEFTHGVTDKTSGLVYETQSGALNEAISDIFGAIIEHSLKPQETKNWIIGEDIIQAGKGLRDLANPALSRTAQPSHMSKFVNTQQDNGGVHINSGIVNNAAFLMTVGGTNPVSKTKVEFGIGWEKSEKLWYRANTKYFLKTTTFGAAAQGVMSAAKDIGLTEAETNIVDCAFKATGIAQGACATIINPQAPVPTEPTDPNAEEAPPAEETPAAPAPKMRRKVVTTEEGCNATGSSSGTDVGPIAAMLAVVLGLASKRRRRN